MKNKWGKVLCLILAVLTLSGCQLAKQDLQQAETQDRMIGMFLTWDYLDLFDEDAYFEENAGRLIAGKTVDTASYEARLYAKRTENMDYVFEGVEGMNCFFPEYTDENGNQYSLSCVDEAISGGHNSIHVSDEGESRSFEGIIYMRPADDEKTLRHNYVFQTADGDVYVTTGQGISFISGGSEWSFNVNTEDKQTNAEGGTESYTFDMTIRVKTQEEAEEIHILQMGEDHAVLDEQIYACDTLPDEVKTLENCAYIVAEERGPSGVKRSIYQPEDEGMTFYSPREDDVMIGKYVRFQW